VLRAGVGIGTGLAGCLGVQGVEYHDAARPKVLQALRTPIVTTRTTSPPPRSAPAARQPTRRAQWPWSWSVSWTMPSSGVSNRS